MENQTHSIKHGDHHHHVHEDIVEENQTHLRHKKQDLLGTYALPASIVFAAIVVVGGLIYMKQSTLKPLTSSTPVQQEAQAEVPANNEEVTPSQGVELPVTWGDLGKKLVNAGVIDNEKFKALYEQGGGTFPKEYENLLTGDNNGKIVITNQNSGYILNLLWALGLGNKNTILDTGEMADKKYGGAQVFASTGGWTVSRGNVMDHFSRHALVNLTPEQQALVDRMSRGIYRICCGNSTHFPDCNHGMAMLGLLELMASQGVSEQDMWKAALTVNSYWFPDAYSTIATYMKSKGVSWKDVNPQEILGAEYSSAQGYGRISSQVTIPGGSRGGSGCGLGGNVSSGPAQRSQGGCSL